MPEVQIKLPKPISKGEMSLDEAISKRRSIRIFKADCISLAQLSKLLWSAQGITESGGYRTVPSAGATFPLEIFTVSGEQTIEGLSAGICHYKANKHTLILNLKGDFRNKLVEAALGQYSIATAPLCIVVCAEYSRTTNIYGQRGERYIHMEVGHAGQNISLQAIALGLASVMIGAFNDKEVCEVLKLNQQLRPLYIIPVGKSG